MDTSAFTDKDSKKPEYRELYEENDYLTAYSLHTDLRIARDGKEAAIGSNDKGGQGWDEHGQQQLDFLKSRGLLPEHKLLDFGCGTGRLASKAVPYLNEGNYTGMDISRSGIDECLKLANDENMAEKWPLFIYGNGTMDQVEDQQFHLIWAHSVFTHLPPEAIKAIFGNLAGMSFGEFCFTYKRSDSLRRSGLKQFQYPPSWLIATAKEFGLACGTLPHEWPAGQKTMNLRHA
tara:strand:+ start:1053 stop:1751 length:699 start_codon:yes stop_codon:yes gene_type:complete